MFGLVKRGVGAFNQRFERVGLSGFRHADAQGDADFARVGVEGSFHKSQPQAFGDGMGGVQVRFGEEHDEFFAAVPTDQICGAGIFQAALRHLMQYLVSGGMTVFVVDLFEMVNVEHHDAERTVDAARALEFEFARVEQTHRCQTPVRRVGDRLGLAFAEEPGVFERARNLVSIRGRY